MKTDFSGKRVAVLGAGKMGGILLKALLEKRIRSLQNRLLPRSSMRTGRVRCRRRSSASRSVRTTWRR